tara:strand:+ start:1812 stop:2717 length:906 start_codon:yes stop_codon:yes gene_type:complete
LRRKHYSNFTQFKEERLNMRYLNYRFLLCIVLFACMSIHAQKKTVAVGTLKINSSVEEAAVAEGKGASLKRVAEAIDGQIINALNGTRKFTIVSRSDSDAIMEEKGALGEIFSFADADYLLVANVDDFQDYVQEAYFPAMGKTVKKRQIRLGMVANIYDKDSRLIESTNFQFDNKDTSTPSNFATESGNLSDALLRQIAEQMGSKISTRVVDVIYPAKILALTGKQATVSRGDGTGIAKDQIWEVFALGEDLIDPDTGENLGGDEVYVGEIKIIRVTPKFSSGIITEDYGVTKGSIVRRKS